MLVLALHCDCWKICVCVVIEVTEAATCAAQLPAWHEGLVGVVSAAAVHVRMSAVLLSWLKQLHPLLC